MGLVAEMRLLVAEEGLFESVILIVTGMMMRQSEVGHLIEKTFVLL